ncbi:MAG: hypothetical protein OXU30_03890 [Gammaproteobacteria bacterium]|nr:hypothetical protein [Gammaproteobacteria bacterium]
MNAIIQRVIWTRFSAPTRRAGLIAIPAMFAVAIEGLPLNAPAGLAGKIIFCGSDEANTQVRA